MVFALMAFWSWRKWPDLLIDFGQQLYIPWQLASGKLLYKDIVILHGPLSQHFNAFWFKLFGPSLTVIIFVNLAILACMTGIIYTTIRRFADFFTATVVCLVLLSLFGFSQYVEVGNYNYVTPYTHEATHGMALAAAMILGLSDYLTRGGRIACAASGICLGLALMTKVDVALAAAVAAFIGFAIAGFIAPPSASPKRDGLLLFCAMALAPAVGFFLYFLSYLPAEQAVRAAGQGFFVLSGEVARTPFYLRMLGFDKPGDNLTHMMTMFVAVAGFVLTAAAADIICRRSATESTANRHWLGYSVFAGAVREARPLAVDGSPPSASLDDLPRLGDLYRAAGKIRPPYGIVADFLADGFVGHVCARPAPQDGF